MTVYDCLLRASLAIVMTAPLLIASAQSRRVVPKPQPAPTPTPPATSPSQSQAGPNSVDAGGGDTYKLIFPTDYEGKLYFLAKEREEMDRTRRSRFKNFFEHLNKAGEQGYKLASVTAESPHVALVKLDEARYEYAWFETLSDRFFALGGFEGKYAELSSRGFRLARHSLLSLSCENLDPDNSASGLMCESRHMFLLEREKGVEKPGHHVLVSSAPGWGAKPGLVLLTKIKEKLGEGFYPTHVLSKHEILLEQRTKHDERLTDISDVQVVASSWSNDVKDKVNELAKQGYRLALINNGIAVMYRRGETAPPFTYTWLKAKDKSFEKQLAKLQESGALYRMTCPDDEGDESRLVFEQNLVDEGRRLEYKVLKFEFQFVENAAEGRVHIDLAPSSKETMKILNRLVKERFAVRDLFVSKEVSVILERSL